MSNAGAGTGYPLAGRIRGKIERQERKGEEQGCTTAAVRQGWLKATGSQSITNLGYDFANFPIFCSSG